MRRFTFSIANPSWASVPVEQDGARFISTLSVGRDGMGALEMLSHGSRQYRLIYLAIALQTLNMLLAIYMTSFLYFGDVLLDLFGSWALALAVKALAFGIWIILRECRAARAVAWVIAPISLLALIHDLVLIV